MDAPSLEVRIGEILHQRRLTLALAESCTGGLIGHRITNVPGSSTYFLGGVIAYSYDAKERLLDVRHTTLYETGAVSEQTAIEMAAGARRTFNASITISVTGIAGPGGGLPGKPVGLTYIGLSTQFVTFARKYLWNGDREANKAQSAQAALQLLLDYLNDHNLPGEI